MKRVLFSLVAGRAKDVRLVGDFTDGEAGPLIMDRINPRIRTFAAAVSLPPGTYQYKFIVDGQWVEDPKADSVPNQFGTQNLAITIED
jgi:1,4-alpha-glucan branching enzyme